ncbi:hypothetical protein DOJK_00280 [Patescibacteria group bacterium]|nr:hypothetical protein DOJK_00280 [Patescibacteria group bacterium]
MFHYSTITMLKKLTLQNFTTFEYAELNFVSGINIIIGENSSGKSHILKLAYGVACVWDQLGKEGWTKSLVKKLNAVFKVENLIELRNRNKILSDDIYRVNLEFFVSHKKVDSQELSFDITSFNKISVNGNVPTAPITNRPLFIPAKEVLSIYPNFTALYEKYALSFDETYYDVCKAVESPLLKNPNEQLIKKIECLMGGRIIFKNNNFCLQTEEGDINIFMVAEGWRKLGMLSYLIANDSLNENSILFWDEPEANLNPRLIKKLVAFLIELSQHKVQIVIATHSLFLMKYFDFLLNKAETNVPAAFFNLRRGEQGVCVEQAERLNQLSTIVSLEEELELYDKEQSSLCDYW